MATNKKEEVLDQLDVVGDIKSMINNVFEEHPNGYFVIKMNGKPKNIIIDASIEILEFVDRND